MKKILAIALMLLNTPVVAAMTCNPTYGEAYEGTINKRQYCKSVMGYKNYWSAEMWCKSIGGELIDVANDCESTSSCDNLDFSMVKWVWTSTVAEMGSRSNIVYLMSGLGLGDNARSSGTTSASGGFALCREAL